MLPIILCFLIPITVVIELDLAGGFFLVELVTPCLAAIFAFQRKSSVSDRLTILIIKLGLVYLTALVVSDLWNGSRFDQFSRGWARLGIFLINLVSIYILLDNQRRRVIAFTMGLVVGRILAAALDLDENILSWKLGFSKPVALAATLACVMLYRYRHGVGFGPIVLLSLGFYNLLMDFRSLAAILVATAVILLASDLKKNQAKRKHRLSAKTFAATVVCGLVAAVGTYEVYVFAAKSDWLGERAIRKFEAQTENTDLPLLFAGRNELLVSIEAILDAPLLGHGSWPESRYYAEKISLLRYQHQLNNRIATPKSDLIPTHSHLFGGWIEAGLAGGVFWAAILYFVSASITRSYLGQSSMRPLYVYCSLLLIWDIFFSPFSGFRRLETAYLIVVSLRGLLKRHRATRNLASRQRHSSLQKRGKFSKEKRKQDFARSPRPSSLSRPPVAR